MKILLVINGTAQQIDILEARRLRRALNAKLAAATGDVMRTNPCIKWAGGKAKLLPELLTRVPARFKDYYEPFAGGSALFFALQARDPNSKRSFCLSDSNTHLINFYWALQNLAESLIQAAEKLSTVYNKRSSAMQCSFYYTQRELLNSTSASDSMVDQAARFLFLNKTCFNGLYRENKKGQFNVPWGKRVWFEVDRLGLLACGAALQRAEILCLDFELCARGLERGDFAYFDPPYVPASASANFTAYQKEPFGPEQQTRLRDLVLDLKKRGVQVLLSNSDTPLVQTLYSDGFRVDRIEARRNINSDGAKRGPVGELLIT